MMTGSTATAIAAPGGVALYRVTVTLTAALLAAPWYLLSPAAALAEAETAGEVALDDELEQDQGDELPEILTLGTGAETTYLVDHGDTISIYAEKVPLETLVEHLRNVGGPEIVSVEPLDRQVTLTVHRASMAEVMRRLLDGYSFLYRYRSGRIATVSVVGAIEGRQYTVPSAHVSRAHWTRVELGEADD